MDKEEVNRLFQEWRTLDRQAKIRPSKKASEVAAVAHKKWKQAVASLPKSNGFIE